MKKLTYTKTYRANQTQQIGPDDDAGMSVGAIIRHLRATLQRNHPHLLPAEIERRLRRIMQRGMRRT